ncbi:MAG TPA: cyclic nucleotide-binding domain-containing protein [Candidatus Methylomirabilis sp.]|nr:cyclic nucleotide-binding domain-containing protein [Candidatus Methylomirabilis sp.]
MTNPNADMSGVRQILKAVPFFRDLTPEELDWIVGLGRIVTYTKDMVLFKEGDQGEALYLVVDGSVRVSKTGPGSADQPMAFMERGSCFGEMALVDEFPRSATAVANQESRILFIEKQAFLNFLEQHPVVGRKILWAFCRSLSMRLREASDRIVALSSFTRPF